MRASVRQCQRSGPIYVPVKVAHQASQAAPARTHSPPPQLESPLRLRGVADGVTRDADGVLRAANRRNCGGATHRHWVVHWLQAYYRCCTVYCSCTRPLPFCAGGKSQVSVDGRRVLACPRVTFEKLPASTVQWTGRQGHGMGIRGSLFDAFLSGVNEMRKISLAVPRGRGNSTWRPMLCTVSVGRVGNPSLTAICGIPAWATDITHPSCCLFAAHIGLITFTFFSNVHARSVILAERCTNFKFQTLSRTRSPPTAAVRNSRSSRNHPPHSHSSRR